MLVLWLLFYGPVCGEGIFHRAQVIKYWWKYISYRVYNNFEVSLAPNVVYLKLFIDPNSKILPIFKKNVAVTSDDEISIILRDAYRSMQVYQ